MAQLTRETDERAAARSITSELTETFREAAVEVLKPAMRHATASAAKYAVRKGPGVVKNRVAPRIQEAGGAGALAIRTAKAAGLALCALSRERAPLIFTQHEHSEDLSWQPNAS